MGWRFVRWNLALLDSAESLASIVGEVRLAQLAVVHQVHARVSLELNHLGHRAAYATREGRLVIGLSRTLGVEHLSEVLGSRQAAGVSGQNPLGTPLHLLGPSP